MRRLFLMLCYGTLAGLSTTLALHLLREPDIPIGTPCREPGASWMQLTDPQTHAVMTYCEGEGLVDVRPPFAERPSYCPPGLVVRDPVTRRPAWGCDETGHVQWYCPDGVTVARRSTTGALWCGPSF